MHHVLFIFIRWVFRVLLDLFVKNNLQIFSSFAKTQDKKIKIKIVLKKILFKNETSGPKIDLNTVVQSRQQTSSPTLILFLFNISYLPWSVSDEKLNYHEVDMSAYPCISNGLQLDGVWRTEHVCWGWDWPKDHRRHYFRESRDSPVTVHSQKAAGWRRKKWCVKHMLFSELRKCHKINFLRYWYFGYILDVPESCSTFSVVYSFVRTFQVSFGDIFV